MKNRFLLPFCIIISSTMFLFACGPSEAEIATATAGAAQQLTATQQQAQAQATARQATAQSAVTQTAQASLQGSIIYTANNKNQQTSYVYSSHADGSGMQKVLNVEDKQYSFDISPDGQYLIYENLPAAEEYSHLFVADVKQNTIVRLTDQSRFDWNPIFSPNGDRILFLSETGDHNWQVYVINVDGSGMTNLTKNSYMNTDPAWSPDGSKVLFLTGLNPLDSAYSVSDLLSGKGSSGIDKSIYVMNADGSGKIRLPLPEDICIPSSPTWSPDGTRILFSCLRSIVKSMDWDAFYEQEDEYMDATLQAYNDQPAIALYVELYVMDADGKNMTLISQDALAMGYGDMDLAASKSAVPAWSPDGSRISYVSFNDTGATMVVANADGSNKQVVKEMDSKNVNAISWSPDSSLLLFTISDKSNSSISNYEIYVMKVDGTLLTKVAGPFDTNPHAKWLDEPGEVKN